MDDAKLQLADKLKNANNILVTVSRNPSVDQLAACLGLTLLLNKLNKHAAAVFSGEVPSTIEFLQPEETLEKTTDSLRDFIIALDKSKADKLRYKVEDNIVRIFITPYRTSITQDDLEFSQGDFNVDVVVALGVHEQTDLDDAIIAHGRILHDATVGTINISTQAGIGAINWNDATASSLSELVTELAQAIDKDLIDGQIATALLTGIVAETNRFSNEKTTSQTMSVSAALMAAGANQQLVATKLSSDAAAPAPKAPISDAAPPEPATKPDPGTLEINHNELPSPVEEPLPEIPEEPEPELTETPVPGPAVTPEPEEPEVPETPSAPPANDHLSSGSKLITEPPTMGGTLSANVRPEALDPITDPLSLPTENKGQILSRSNVAPMPEPPAPEEPAKPVEAEVPESPKPTESEVESAQPEPPKSPEPQPSTSVVTGLTPPPPAWVPPEPETPELDDKSSQTLTELEESVGSSHAAPADDASLDQARQEVSKAFNDSSDAPIPATPETPPETVPDPPATPAPDPASLAFDPTQFGIDNDETLPPTPAAPAIDTTTAPAPQVVDPNAPPPVPPPIPFQFGNPNPPAQ